MRLRCLKSFATPLAGYQASMVYDLPGNDQVRRWVADGMFEVIEQDAAELAAFRGGTPKKRGPGRPRKNPQPA